jgi:H+/Cl- antiporter ClcA
MRSTTTVVEFSIAFVCSAMLALFIRSTRIRENRWQYFTDIASMPTSQDAGIFLYATFISFLPAIVSYVIYYLFTDPVEFNSQTPNQLLQALAFRLIFSAVWGFLAVTICAVVDIVASRDRSSVYDIANYIKILMVTVIVCFIILLLTPGIDPASRVFWHRIVGVTLIASSGLLVFVKSLQTRIARGSAPLENQV